MVVHQECAAETAGGLHAVRYRGLKRSTVENFDIFYGTGRGFQIDAGSLITLVNVGGGAPVWLAAIDANSNNLSPSQLGLENATSAKLDAGVFQCEQLHQLSASRGLALDAYQAAVVFDDQTAPNERFIFHAKNTCTLFIIFPRDRETLTQGGGGRMRLEIQRNRKNSQDFELPDPLGKVRDEWRIARASAFAYEVKKGQFIQVLDVEGQQCSDFMAMRTDALEKGVERYIDSTVTRSLTAGAYPRPGMLDKFFDQDLQPLLAVVQDTVGRHDTFALACTARGYEERGFPGHINCSDNISNVYEPFGIQRRAGWPAVNFFFNSQIDAGDNNLTSDEAWSHPGDHITMLALTDLVCVSTACPDDVDPINGWNPTDIHVRVYEEDSTIQKSMYYRAEPQDEGTTTQHSAFHPRTSKLTSHFQVARDIWMPTHFDATGAVGEYWACREAATLQDMSSLRKFDVMGPDAEQLLQHCMTRNVAKLAENRGFYALVCDERGSVLDDGTLFRLAPDVFRWCCGSDNSGLHLQEQAEKLGLRVWVKALSASMPNLALQGPKSRDILSEIVFTQPTKPSLENIKWFGMTIARLHDRNGPSFMLTRSGFTGELGYEVFCDSGDALEIWDAIMATGASHGIKEMGGTALDMMRIEAGLMAAGAEFGPDVDAFESGLGFAIDFKKKSFNGREALERNSAAPRRKLVGLKFPSDEHPSHGDAVFTNREQVGVVTSATRSPELGHAIAMARVAIENAELGAKLEVGKLDGHMKRLPCEVCNVPFIDAQREKPRA